MNSYLKLFLHFSMTLMLCGVSATQAANNQAKVIGGTDVPPNSALWVSALVRKGSGAFNGPFCGGSLIHPDWVLTAAHCVDEVQAGNLDIVVGQQELNATTGERISVDQILAHPGFNPNTLQNDIALIKLSQSATTLPKVLLPDSNNANGGEASIILGWGTINPNGNSFPPTLQMAEVPVLSDEDCRSAFPGEIDGGMLCAGFPEGGKDSCQGDSGGPLVLSQAAADKRVQIGITSWGIGCAEPNHPGIYTRLSSYADIVENVICSGDIELPAPILSSSISTNPNIVSLSWTEVPGATGYYLHYESIFPGSGGTGQLDLGKRNSISFTLPAGAAYLTSVSAYRGICHDDSESSHSNAEEILIPAT